MSVLSSPRLEPQGSPEPRIKAPSPASKFLLASTVSSLFRYRKTSLTLAIVLTYVISFVVVSYTTNVAQVALPDDAADIILLQQSWLHLQKISASPHPYSSLANDEVHAYILAQVKLLLVNSYTEYADDKDNKILFNQRNVFNSADKENRVIYYESNNVLARVNGTDPTLPALLISAHFDSVPSAYGTTDDGMGIASMLALLEHFSLASTPQPLRTVVFNFNNNEEFGLLGATAFFNHHYSENVAYFINLEGTGAGGKAILFRATDYGVSSYYSAVRSPFGSSIFQQGFSNGLVHSETDYKVYKEHGLRGVDIAFYKPRSIYHTAGDSIQGSDKHSLWHMLSTAKDYVEEVVGQAEVNDNLDTPVFFDLLGKVFVTLPASALSTLNVIALTVVPLLVLLLLLVVLKRGTWSVSVTDTIWFPLSIGASVFITHAATQSFFGSNPLVVSADYVTPVAVASAIFLLSNYAALSLLTYALPVHNEKLVYILELTFVLWVVLLKSVVEANGDKAAHSGEYAYTAVFLCFSGAAIIGLVGLSIKRTQNYEPEAENGETVPLLEEETIVYSDEPPTLKHDVKNTVSSLRYLTYDWSLQFLVLAPVSLVVYSCGDLVFQGLHQTSQESALATTMLHKFTVLIAVAWSLPFLPFVVKFNRYLVYFLVLTALFGSFSILHEPPFSKDSPLKLRFLQAVDKRGATVEVYGREGFVRAVVEDLPSVKESGQNVTCVAARDGSETCYYEGPGPKAHSVDVEILKNGSEIVAPFEPLSGEVKLHALQNRNCVIRFNTTGYPEAGVVSPVKSITIYQDKNSTASPKTDLKWDGGHVDKLGNYVYRDMNGIDQLLLHKLSWDQWYHLGVQWIPNFRDDYAMQTTTALGVSVQCYYGEADAESVPAYTELVQYSPKLVSIANMASGLVVVNQYFEF
ncbi:hypothetical protein BABINDRAFT_159639 [Babjeviella inositovora NRRL Y-12698]|uniref:Peptide hydrolase n=1 Tax=Babjeviella inositovora NRRL Y-12698 TaxID=984486 RepID=A0A1E3QZT3_9ASCO|nr:uncharacterized protein BABINDRAFT_159639 [Babjeviella inositovora NRRL Y-12698]ODQ83199.1 hypothetical protein BABINDRAFT_159639 [Babjeviella inositovora NRRL Y-12698]